MAQFIIPQSEICTMGFAKTKMLHFTWQGFKIALKTGLLTVRFMKTRR